MPLSKVARRTIDNVYVSLVPSDDSPRDNNNNNNSMNILRCSDSSDYRKSRSDWNISYEDIKKDGFYVANFYTKQTNYLSTIDLNRSYSDESNSSIGFTNFTNLQQIHKKRVETYRTLKAESLSQAYYEQQTLKGGSRVKDLDVPVKIRLIGSYKADTPAVQKYTWEDMNFKLLTYVADVDSAHLANVLKTNVDVVIYIVDSRNLSSCRAFFSERKRMEVPLPVILAISIGETASPKTWSQVIDMAQKLNVYGCVGHVESIELNSDALFELAVQAFLDNSEPTLPEQDSTDESVSPSQSSPKKLSKTKIAKNNRKSRKMMQKQTSCSVQ